jgi:UDP-N-acetylmuramate: L-alanyl-gamma-D-glutamyl-meso-diaminopimelate ligase
MTRIHLIGICGTAMATLAALLKSRGYDVRGSDQNVYPPMSDFLQQQGIVTLQGYRAEHIAPEIDLVVVGNAISRGNAELEEVLNRKIRHCSLPEAVRDHFLWGARSIVIAGTHGKTTTTSLAGWVLANGGADPSVFVGGIAENFESSYRVGGGRDFVIEGDEYDSAFFDKTAKFLKYLPDIAVVNNIEFDHADIYPDLAAIRLAFQRFVNLIPRRGLLLLGSDNPEALALRERAQCPVETFGTSEGSHWQAHDLRVDGTATTFSVRRGGQPIGSFELPLLGTYNVRNALAAIAVGAAVGLNTDTIAQGLRRFKGVRRRMQLRGSASGVAVYDDFAHHPTAIAETLAGVRSAFPGRTVWAIFEPRSATSCRRIFQSDFARALAGADRVVLPAVFRSSLPEDERLSVDRLIADLKAQGVDARYIPQVDDIVKHVARETKKGDLVVVMSNGGFDDIHQKLLAALEERARR